MNTNPTTKGKLVSRTLLAATFCLSGLAMAESGTAGAQARAAGVHSTASMSGTQSVKSTTQAKSTKRVRSTKRVKGTKRTLPAGNQRGSGRQYQVTTGTGGGGKVTYR